MSATPTPPKPQPIAEKPNNSKRDKEGQDDEHHPNTPPEDQGDNVKRGDPPGGGGGPAPRPPLTPTMGDNSNSNITNWESQNQSP